MEIVLTLAIILVPLVFTVIGIGLIANALQSINETRKK